MSRGCNVAWSHRRDEELPHGGRAETIASAVEVPSLRFFSAELNARLVAELGEVGVHLCRLESREPRFAARGRALRSPLCDLAFGCGQMGIGRYHFEENLAVGSEATDETQGGEDR